MTQMVSKFGKLSELLGGLGKGLREGSAMRTEAKAIGRGLIHGPPMDAMTEGVPPLLSMGRLGRYVGRHPVAASVDAAMFAPMLARGAVGLGSDIGHDLNIGGVEDTRFERERRNTSALRALQRHMQRKQEERERLIQENTALLAERAPQLFNSIMAGRRLPRNAVVFGGTPRTDLLREVAENMSQGAYTQPTMDGGLYNG